MNLKFKKKLYKLLKKLLSKEYANLNVTFSDYDIFMRPN